MKILYQVCMKYLEQYMKYSAYLFIQSTYIIIIVAVGKNVAAVSKRSARYSNIFTVANYSICRYWFTLRWSKNISQAWGF